MINVKINWSYIDLLEGDIIPTNYASYKTVPSDIQLKTVMAIASQEIAELRKNPEFGESVELINVELTEKRS